MAAIITTPFRTLNAENFKDDIANSNVYIGIGKSDAWSDSTADITDYVATEPTDTTDATNEARQNLIALKKIESSDLSHVIRREDWAAGKTYIAWDSNDAEIYDKNFYVLTEEFKVYKCIHSPMIPSLNQPVHTSAASLTLADGYIWRYMYTLTGSDIQKFLTISYLPVKTVDTSASLPTNHLNYAQQQSQIAAAALSTAGGIERIVIENGGQDYSTAPTVNITGDGTAQATATCTVLDGKVNTITITAKGADYTVADITFSGGGGSEASARAVISPVNGHGTDPVAELGGFFISLNAQLEGNEAGDLTVNQDFRQISIIKNPKNPSAAALTANTANAMKYLELLSDAASFSDDDVIVGGTNGAKAFIGDIDVANNKIYYYQNAKTGYGTFSDGEQITSGATTATLIGSNSVNEAEVDTATGQMLFLENRDAIFRTDTQTEDIKCIIEF